MSPSRRAVGFLCAFTLSLGVARAETPAKLCEAGSGARGVRYLIPRGDQRLIEVLRAKGARFDELREDRVFGASELVAHRRGETHVVAMPTATPAGTVVASLEPAGSGRVFAAHESGLPGQAPLETPILRDIPRLRPHVRLRTAPFRDERVAVAAEKEPLTFEIVYGKTTPPNLVGSPLEVLGWTAEGDAYLEIRDGQVVRVDPETGNSLLAHDTREMARSLASIPGIDEETAATWAGQKRLHTDAARRGALFEHERDLYYARLDGSHAIRLTSTPEVEELAKFSPDGEFVAFVRQNDLRVVDVSTGRERALTRGGSDLLRHGKADWVYFEEVFDRDWNAFWWSPDSRHLAFLRTDSSSVPTFTIVDDIPARQRIEVARYPKPGEENPRVSVGLVSVTGGDVRWVDLSSYDSRDLLITGVGFFTDGQRVYFYGQNRTQTWLDLLTVPVAGGTPTRLFRETTEAWVSIPPAPRFLSDGSFLWTSERSGWQHVYHIESDGKLRRALTSGEWEARRVHAVDESGGWVYISGTKDSPIAENLYRVKLDASSIERLTPDPGNHSVLIAPKTFAFIDSRSSLHEPTRVELRTHDGALRRTLDTNPVADLDRFSLGRVEPLRVRARDGYELPATVLKPARFDPKLRYPLWIMTYAGPHAPTVRDRWTSGDARVWDQVLAASGVVVVRCDPRSATGRGAVSAWSAYRQLGVRELEDLTDIVGALTKEPWIDAARVGLSGYSYGGFMTAYAMTRSKLFAAGFSGAPVTDWRDYDSIYTERYMSTPQDNPTGYARTSVVDAASDLHGRLLLVHGTMDDNVHVQNSLRLIRALQQAGKSFEFMIYPGSRHGIWANHLRNLRYAFILESLRPQAPDTSSRRSLEF